MSDRIQIRNSVMHGRHRPQAVVCFLLVVLAVGHAHADVDDFLSQRWYQTEIIVFERPAIDHTNTAEQLTSVAPGKQPAQLASFVQGVGPDYELVTGTKRMLRAGRIQSDSAVRIGDGLPALTNIPEFVVAAPLASESIADPIATEPQDPLPEFMSLVGDFEEHLQHYSYYFIADQTPQLQEAFAKLSPRRGYRVVWRGHWIQPVPDRDTPQPLLVQAGRRFDDRFQLEGSVALTVSRYLHLNLKLWYYQPDWRYLPVRDPQVAQPGAVDGLTSDAIAPTPEVVLGPKVYMHLQAKARMRSAELHYLDHPKFGVLVRVDPVTPPANLVAWHKLVAAATAK